MTVNFQYFSGNILSSKPLGNVSLDYFVESIRKPKEYIKTIFNEIAKCETEKNWKRKAELKQNNLFFFTPSVIFNDKGRSYSDITEFTGIMVIEFDHVGGDVEAKRDHLFNSLESVICCFVSPSKNGYKALIKIPKVNSVDEYKEYYCGISHYLEGMKSFDDSNINCSLPLFLSWDSNILYRKNPSTWTKRGFKKSYVKEFEGELPELGNVSSEDVRFILKNAYRRIRKADEEMSGHPNVVKASLYLGNFCSSGYINFEQSKQNLFNWIEKSPYLSHKSDTYKKTSITMLNNGLRKPRYLPKHSNIQPEELKINNDFKDDDSGKYKLFANTSKFILQH